MTDDDKGEREKGREREKRLWKAYNLSPTLKMINECPILSYPFYN